jgi:tripartite-type tricarboxylate transporter receptor subunit TctC
MEKLLNAILVVFSLVSGFGFGSGLQAAEKYPAKPITVIIPAEPGSDGDILMRPVIQKASEIIGKPMVVVNKPGGGNTIGYREIHAAKPDGYTIGMSVTSIASTRLLGLLSYDHRDFTSIGLVFTGYPTIYASVKGQRTFKTMEEVIAFAKKNPGEVSMATTAVGGIYWITAMVLQEGLGVKFNVVPQEGSGGFVVTQVAGGHQDIGTSGFSSAKAQIDAGNIRLLAIAGERRAYGKYGYAPTLKEIGYDLSLNTFGGLIGPRQMSKDISDRLIRTFEMACNNQEVQAHFIARNYVPLYLPGEKLVEFCDREKEINRRILGKAGLLKEK